MPRWLEPFSSIEDLAPVFEHGGQLTFVYLMVHPGCCIVRERDPWEIVMRGFGGDGLHDQQETLIHEFMHLSHRSHYGYHSFAGLRHNKLFHEVATERASIALLRNNPGIADEITKELISHPNCSITFESDKTRETPFWGYYHRMVTELAKEVRDETSPYEEIRRIKILRLANKLNL